MLLKRRIRAHTKKFELKKILPRLYIFLPYMLTGMLFFLLANNLWGYLSTNEHFDVRYVDVYVDGRPAPANLRDYYGIRISGNIMKSNLSSLAEELKSKHPETRSITLVRQLPNRIRLEVAARKAVAQLKSGRYYPVDKEGMVIADVRDEPLSGLVIIIGAEGTQGRPVIGKKCQTSNLIKAFELLSQVQRSNLTKIFPLRYIDCSDPKNPSFYICEPIVEIRMGDRDFRQKLLILSSIFDKIGRDVSGVKYVDLRFKDPVVGPRLKR